MELKRPSVSRMRDIIGIEVAMLFFYFAQTIGNPLTQALVYRKACLQRYNDNHLCDKLKSRNYSQEENEVQTIASHWYLYQSLANIIPATFLTFILGSWTDRNNHKLSLVLPIVGFILAHTWLAVNAVHMEWPLWPIILSDLVLGFSGGTMTQVMAAYSYLSHVTSEKTRTLRVSILQACVQLGGSSGFFLSGVMFTATGFAPTYSLGVSLMFAMVLYILLWLKPIKREKTAQSETDKRSGKGCSLNDLTASVRCVVKKREGNKRVYVLLLNASVVFILVGIAGRSYLTFLYVKRRPLHWDQALFSTYMSISGATRGISQLLLVPAIKHFLKIRDTTLLTVGILAYQAGGILFSVSVETWMVFAGIPFTMISSAVFTCLRSLLSVNVDMDEQGKVFALFAVSEEISLMAANFLYNLLYPVTLSFWAGFSFFLGALILLPPLAMAIYLHIAMKRENPYKDLMDNAEEQEMSEDLQMDTQKFQKF